MAPRRRRQPESSSPQISTPSERAADRARIADIDAQISARRKFPRALKDERELLQRWLAAYTYPVLTLPNEIVAEIFIRFLPPYPRRPPPTGPGVLSPATLGQICRKWREIAFSTPALWRAISLYLCKRKRLESNLLLLKTWLKRSSPLPLSIRLVEGDHMLLDLQRFAQAIVPHSARLEYVRIRLPLRNFSTEKTTMPLLRSLEVGLSMGFEDFGSISFLDAPVLHKVTLERYHRTFAAAGPWAQLTMLVIGAASPHECLGILNRTLNLVHCSLHVVPDPGNTAVTTQSLPHLVSLVFTIDLFRPVDLVDVVARLALPALHRFQIPEFRDDPIAPLLSLIARSECSLQELYITNSSQADASVYHTRLPSIPKITFNCPQSINRDVFADESSDIEEVFYNESTDTVSDSEGYSDGGSDGSW